MALLILGSVFLGFAHTYYLAGVFRAPLPSFIVHVHGAAFSCWILLLVTQTALVSAGRVDMHRRLGILGFLLACSMVILGVLAATNSLARGFAPPGLDPLTFYVIPITDMAIFATLIFFAFRNRSDPSGHKRFILIATIALLIAAIARWPFTAFLGKPIAATLFSYVFLLLLVAYDLWSIRKVHRASVMGGRLSCSGAADQSTYRPNRDLACLRRVGPIFGELVGGLVGYRSVRAWICAWPSRKKPVQAELGRGTPVCPGRQPIRISARKTTGRFVMEIVRPRVNPASVLLADAEDED